MRAMAMLKVKSRSSANGGSGSTITARIITTTSGAISARIALTFGPSSVCSCCRKAVMCGSVHVVRIELVGHVEHRHLAGHGRRSGQRGAELIDISEHLRHRGEQGSRNLAVELGVGIQRPG